MLMTIGLALLMFVQSIEFLLYLGIMFLSSGGFSLLVTNHSLSVLFPAISGFIIVFGQSVFQISGSLFRVWSWIFAAGVDFR